MLKLNLSLPTAPFWVDLPEHGVRLQLRPLTMAVNSAIQSYVSARVADLTREMVERAASQAPLDDLPDWTDPDIRAGHTRAMLARALARFGIVAWEGVADLNGEPLPVTPRHAEAFAELVGDRFVAEYQAGLAALAAEGNASGAAPNGGSAPRETTAPGASQVH